MFSGEKTAIDAMREAAWVLRSVSTSTSDELRAIEVAIRALQAAKCERLAEMDVTRKHEAEGASSIGTWARRELHQDAGLTRQMVRAASTCRDLPAVGEAARSGAISFGHVNSFTYALKHVGVEETRQLDEPLVEIAKALTPAEFHAKVRQIRDVLHPDDLDRAWLDGMDKRDIRLAKTVEGWHLTGFLDIETGAKLDAILKNLSVPRDGGDERSPAERRMDALDEMCTRVLGNGLPSDNGIRPHITVTVEAETLTSIAVPSAPRPMDLDAEPAVLQGFGPIGPALLAHLLCGAEVTPILISTIERNVEILDVGRTERYATPRQAKAISLRQNGACAAPGCRHPISHNHHIVWHSRGGATDLHNLLGLCRKCHSLVHAGKLNLARGSPPAQAA